MTWEHFTQALTYSTLLPLPYWGPALGLRCCPGAQWLTQGGVNQGDGATLRVGWPREGLCHPGVDTGAGKTLLFLMDCAGSWQGCEMCQEAEPSVPSGPSGVTPVPQTEIPPSIPNVVVDIVPASESLIL